jgi:hypothetical protein
MRRLLVLLFLLLTACTTTTPGSPAGTSGAPATTTPATGSSTQPGGDRPKDIDLAAVDLCAVVAALPRADFGLDTDRLPLAGDSSIFPGSKDCFAQGLRTNLALLVVAVLDEGAPGFVETANAKSDRTDALGFPLYLLTNPASSDSCFGALDVKDGQMLYLSYGLAAPDTEPKTPQTTLCQRVPDLARAVLAQFQ